MSDNIPLLPFDVKSKIITQNLVEHVVSSCLPCFDDHLSEAIKLRVSRGNKGYLLYCPDDTSMPSSYLLEKHPQPNYTFLNHEIERNQKNREKRRNIAKVLLRERITGRSIFDSKESLPEGSPYLEYNAQTRGDFGSCECQKDLKYSERVIDQCGKSVIWLEGCASEDYYLKKIDCRKQWCPVCGGKNGVVHKSRKHSIFERVDVEKYNLRQFVFTTPEKLWSYFMDKLHLSSLIRWAKQIIEKYFGEPVYDARGHVKKYRLVKGAIEYLHAFGDELGVFKPHVNVHIFEEKSEKLKLDKGLLDMIKKEWLKKMRQVEATIETVDVHYSFAVRIKKKMHALKYMSRPWSADDYNAVEDERLKSLLVLDLKGFQYMRFWGGMANSKYKDEMNHKDIIKEAVSVTGEYLNFLFVAPFDEKSWLGKVDMIADGLYRIRKRNTKQEEDAFQECLSFFEEKAYPVPGEMDELNRNYHRQHEGINRA